MWPGPDPHPRRNGVAGLVVDHAVGQRFFQFGDARVGDLGVRDVATVQVGYFLEIHSLAIGEQSWPAFQLSDGLIIGGVVTGDRFDF